MLKETCTSAKVLSVLNPRCNPDQLLSKRELIMKTKLISQERAKTYAVILDDGEEFMGS
jgi:hypothetical protein